jgi:hypothetical protein
MYIKDLKSIVIKKKLNAESVCFRWHNKNKSGGNFGINICGVSDNDYGISGRYNDQGLLINLRFGFIYQRGIHMEVKDINEMFEFIENFIKNGS